MNQENALAQLRPQLLRFAMLRLGNRDLAEDAVQETLLAAIEGIDSYAGDSSLAAWLYGILRHKIVDCMRSAGRQEPDPHQDAPLPDSRELAISVSNCWVTLHRARKRLRACPDIRGLAADAL